MSASPSEAEHLDVLVVGAGLSGVGVGRYLRTEHPQRTFAIFEARAVAGGTWDLFRYPGVRSDSDLHTLGYEFNPWREEESIASAPRILAYLRRTATECGLDGRIRYQHKVVAADWSSLEGRWQVDVERVDTGERLRVTASWIFCAGGYFRYEEGYVPQFAGRERFLGTIVHPQAWPENLDYAGKRVVVIGSGSTAVTLAPAMADQVEHLTMLQRTPSYVVPVQSKDAVALWFRRLLGVERGSALTRRKNIAVQQTTWRFCRRFPEAARMLIRMVNLRHLPEGYPVDEHFNPPYNPWDQRLCVDPDGDLFKAIGTGRASVVTDRIQTFTESGILLESGRRLEADIIVTATGLNLQLLGGMQLSVDGRPIKPSETVVYRGMMLSGIPNFAMAIGYTNSSWTLKIGLLCAYFCRLLRHMDVNGYDVAYAVADPAMPTRPLLDFGAGYVQRSLADLPRQGPTAPWLMSMNYDHDRKLLRSGDVADENLHFFVLPCRSQDGGSPRGAVPGTKVKAFDQDNRIGDMRMDRPDDADRFVDLANGVRLCYRVQGPREATPLLLVAGWDQGLTSWPAPFIDALLERGFRVIRHDNRDSGCSSRIQTPPPSKLRQFRERPRRDAYNLQDMADDAVALLDHLGLERVHVLGISMGGMIAQSMAAAHPERVQTLTSLISTTGQSKIGQPAWSTKLRIARPAARTRDASVRRHLDLTAHLAGLDYPPDPAAETLYAEGAWDRAAAVRGPAGAGGARQIQAIQASGDRTEQLRRITAPTLVVHGDRDLIVHPSGGLATADAIPGARHVTIPGMGHHLAPGLLDQLVELITNHIRHGTTP